MRQAHKAIAASLGEALPPMLSVLESALQSNPSGAGLLALENLAEVAEAQPRLFKPVLAQVLVEGTLTSTLTLTLALSLALALALTLTLTRCNLLWGLLHASGLLHQVVHEGRLLVR